MDRFLKDMESVLGRHEMEVSSSHGDAGEGSSSDMDFGKFFFNWTHGSM